MENARPEGQALDENLELSLAGDSAESSEPEPEAQDRGHDWSWSRNRDDIVIPEQPETALYWNPQGQLVIRQCGWPDHDGDHIVIIAPENAARLINALSQMVEAG